MTAARKAARKARHRRSCTGKIQYPTRQAAHEAIGAMVRNCGMTLYATSVYKCTACKAWHWGHIPGSGARR